MSKQRVYKNENDVKKHVKELLDKYEWMHWANSAGPHSVPGIPDRMALKDGVLMAVECKFGGREVTALQERFLQKIGAHGGVWFVVRDTNVKILEDFLLAFENDGVLVRKEPVE